MYFPVLVALSLVSYVSAVWPQKLKQDESAALDIVMRMSELTLKDLIYLMNLQFWGYVGDEILERAKDNKELYEKMLEFRARYDRLSQTAQAYVNEAFDMAMKHARSFNYDQYFKPELLAEARYLVMKIKNLEVYEELLEAFPNLEAEATAWDLLP
ncbi:unnamed protein product [Cylicocyclus nassatus]|uniref:Uncharacterized protein n=1 Tax=Cylicocyclus nassatus TaxID=53992 RepID=A0AA36HBZ7_CYLNA|nr:unnamed protein product [Cylicocyclus nassatus]